MKQEAFEIEESLTNSVSEYELPFPKETEIKIPHLYPYQAESIDGIRREIRSGNKGVVLCAPTGSGKTVVALDMIAKASQKGKRSIFLVDTIELLDQAFATFKGAGLRVGSGSGNKTFGNDLPIQVWTVQTLRSRGWPPNIDVVFVDEAHGKTRHFANTIKDLGCPYVGLTATPMVKGLGKIYDSVVQVTTTNKLLDGGYLAPLNVQPMIEIDTEGLAHNNTGEWKDSDIHQRGRVIYGDIVSTYITETNRHFEGPVKTFLFGASIAHVEEQIEFFNNAGISARVVTHKTEKREREQTMKDFAEGKFFVLGSVAAIAKGVDIPDAKCLIMARPFRKSIASVIQMLGRVMRTHDSKDYALVLDHSGNYLGFQDKIEHFFEHGVSSLDDSKLNDVLRKEKEDIELEDARCGKCGAVMPASERKCGFCGHEKKRRIDVITVPGKMVGLGSAESDEMFRIDPVRKGRAWTGTGIDLWKACCAYSQDVSYQRHFDIGRAFNYAKSNFKRLTGKWPPRNFLYDSNADYVPKCIRRNLDKHRRDYRNQVLKQETAS